MHEIPSGAGFVILVRHNVSLEQVMFEKLIIPFGLTDCRVRERTCLSILKNL